MTTSAEMQIHTMPTITVTDDRIVISRFEHYSLPRTATLYAMDGRCVARWDMLNHQQENAELPLPQIAHGAYTLVLDWGRERQGYVLLVRP